MEIDAAAAAALGWPKTKYAHVERERRWLCDSVPRERVTCSVAIVDIYVAGTRLRLREARDLGTGSVQFKLGRKADVAAAKRLITTIYLSAPEFALLSALPGARLEKLRHTVVDTDGRSVTLDEFGGDLAGLILAEVEFDDDAAMIAYRPPAFVGPEVTNDLRYTGGELASRGLPTGPRR
jgi:CYTH domain-containing protein